VKAHQAEFPIRRMCQVLGVSTSGYYTWVNRPPSARAIRNQALTDQIRQIHESSRGTYGAPRVYEELLDRGIHIGYHRVARLMRLAGLQGVSRRRSVRTTCQDRQATPATDLVERDFSAQAPNQLWIADITYIPTLAGFVYLAVVLDVFSRRVVGWATAANMKAELVVAALDMAISQRKVDRVIHHSDKGSQYTSLLFGNRCKTAGIQLSMGSTGDCYDNAMCESFFATLECELIDRTTFKNRWQAEMEIFQFIEGWYNPHRRHSSIDYLSPINYERKHVNQTKNPNQKLSTKTG